ncbi:MAG: HAMP domain-containing sensor histidine kinase [Cellulosilyticaceae bacterium]
MISKFMSKINNQLIGTFLLITIGVIILFGSILPLSIRYLVDNKIYDLILVEQDHMIKQGHKIDEIIIGTNGIYHLADDDYLSNYKTEELSAEILHQLLMYEDFFRELNKQVRQTDKPVSQYKYERDSDSIYYIINKTRPNETIISYKMDNTSSNLSHQLFMNVLMMMTLTVVLILTIFLKWNMRLINNLKKIQDSLDNIEGHNLQEEIVTDNYTLEFQDVMLSLERMRQRLYEDEKVKQDMIHNISHDLKTPLAVIKNYAEGIIDEVYPYGTVEETAHVIYSQADRLQKKVQGLLYLNKLDYIKSQKETYDTFLLSELVTEIVVYMQEREEKEKMKVNVDESLFIGDREKWRIVIENLIDNAKRYAVHEISITIKDNTLSVYNDGPPIDRNMSGCLFNAFEVGQGGVTGLGLAIVKKTVELYNYTIDFENKAEGGVQFTIW